MKKRIAAFWTAMLLLLGVCVPAAQAQEPDEAQETLATLVSAYHQQGSIYAFLDLKDDILLQPVTASVAVNALPEVQNIPLKSLSETDIPVEFLFVVDTSAAMPQNTREIITGLVQGLMEQSGQKLSISIAAAGEEFTAVKSSMTSMFQVHEAIERLSFFASTGNVRNSLIEAIRYLRSTEKTAGALSNVVLITANSIDGEDLASKLSEVIQNAPDVLIHTVDLNTLTREENPSQSGVLGVHMRIGSEAEANNAGHELAGWISKLYQIECPNAPDDEQDPFVLRISLAGEDGTTVWSSLDLNLGMVPSTQTEQTDSADSTPTDTTPVDTVATEVPAGTDPTPSIETTVSEAPEETVTETTQADVNGEEDNPSGIPLWVYLVSAVAVVVIAVLATLLFLKTRQDQDAPIPVGIPLQLLIVTGSCKKPKKVYYLDTELLIGSDPTCDIVWKDTSVSPRHCRVFMKNGFLWLEDLNPRSKTAIEGMKIYAPNRLRSEDEITIGNVKFKFLF